ncbi:phosphatase PAP2 family protein [Halobacillus campisalis]|uniref:Phosphatase PAP2 family protein n=1 Tax=Halobacillus campisalis TaxID=435909 RepID=A0ABW2K7Y3_9BACI|nr:phosphatase PAP2 family protein [Halobacillus campisalis]
MLFSGTRTSDLSKTSIFIIVFGLLILGGGAYGFTEIGDEVLEQEKFAVDAAAVDIVGNADGTWIDTAMGWVTEAGSVTVITILSVIMIISLLFFIPYSKWVAVYLAVSMIGISLLTSGLKSLFGRDRPELLEQYDGTGYSFPSGHTTGSTVFYGFMIYLIVVSPLSKPVKWLVNILLFLMILAVSLSRVFLNVHYLTDILGGLALGFSWLLVCIAALEIMLWRGRRKKIT